MAECTCFCRTTLSNPSFMIKKALLQWSLADAQVLDLKVANAQVSED